MKIRKQSRQALAWLILSALLIIPSPELRALVTGAVSRDPLTEKEAELVREAQALDKRTEVFIKAAERRLLAVADPNWASSPQAQKDVERWGEVPKGTRAELLTDFDKILDEAVTNIDDVSARDPDNGLLSKSLRRLGAASTQFMEKLSQLRSQLKDEREAGALEQAMESVQEIMAAAGKLPPEAQTKDKADKGKKQKE